MGPHLHFRKTSDKAGSILPRMPTQHDARDRRVLCHGFLTLAILVLVLTGISAGVPVAQAAPVVGYAWTEIAPPSHVTDDLWTTPVWDPSLGHVIAVSQNSTGSLRLYELIGVHWTDLGVPLPSIFETNFYPGCEWYPASQPYMTYDSSDRYLLLIDYSDCNVLAWKLVSHHWAPLPSKNPPPLFSGDAFPLSIYDPSDGEFFLYAGDFGGCDCMTQYIYGYHAGVWRQFSNIPGGADDFGFVYSPALQEVVILNDLENAWTLHSNQWSRMWFHPPVYFTNSEPDGYDPGIHAIVITGDMYDNGCPGECMWLWEDGTNHFVNITATTTNPSVACDFAFTDPGLSGLVCAGSTSPYTEPSSLWEFTATT